MWKSEYMNIVIISELSAICWSVIFVLSILIGVKGVQVEEIWSFDPESFSQIK